MSEREKVDRLKITFGPPDVGWIDFSISAGSQTIEFSISEVFDPFHASFTKWLEKIAGDGRGKLEIDIEGPKVTFDVHGLPDNAPVEFGLMVRFIDGSSESLLCEMPRYNLVRDFYQTLVAYWESPVLQENWLEWNYMAQGKDEADLHPDELIPWNIRSDMVERYLAEGA